MKKKLLVLAYHKVLAPGEHSGGEASHVYDVHQQNFEQQLQVLKDKNCHLVSLEKIQTSCVANRLNVALSFDDGNASDSKIVFPLLAQKNIPASFFVSPNHPQLSCDWDAIREMHHHGFSIGSHGLTHTDLTLLTAKERLYELQTSAEKISDELNAPVDLLSFPFGRYNRAVVEDAQAAGYTHGFTSRFGYNTVAGENFLVHRWSVKKSTGTRAFERVLDNHFFETFSRKFYSRGVFMASSLLGHTVMNRLHKKIKS